MLAEAGLTVTEVRTAAVAVTVTADVPVTRVAPETAVAVIVAEPVATPVTKPVEPTVAAEGLEDAQVMVAPVKAAPFWSLAEALSCWVPFGAMLAEAGLTVTEVRTA